MLGRARDAARAVSRSCGLPWDGQLRGGVRLQPGPTLRYLPQYTANDRFYGTAELVGLLERAAQAVNAQWPNSVLSIGELSTQRGGRIEGHHSHRSGRDADLGFFVHDERGNFGAPLRFMAFDGPGIGTAGSRALHFDDARNWSLVASLLRDQGARLQYAFVSQPLRTRLLMEGRRRGETDAFLRAAAAVLVQPAVGHKHDNHFHIRIYCARDDRPQCMDSAPYWPWYDGAPPNGVYAELPVIRWHQPDIPADELASQVAQKRL